MTTTNRAFIKAYRKDEPQAAPAGPVIAVPARAVAAPVRAPLAHASTVTTERSAIYGPRPAASAVALAQSGPRTPTAEPTDAASRSDRSHHANAYIPGEKRPLSSFIEGAGIARLNTEPAEADFFRPGTTVASFQWPSVCRALSRQCGSELARVTDLLVTHSEAGRSVIGVTSLNRSDGATTASLCLAKRLAERQRRTILVDANFKHPQLTTLLEAEATTGWQEVLVHGTPLSDAAVRATDDGLDLLALGGKMPNDVLRYITGLQTVVTAGVLRHAYDHVILDLGAVMERASQPIVMELVRNMGIDAIVAITRSAYTEHDIEDLADALSRGGCDFLGTIENRA
jgi:Mrp family chromosome partitioning ATPase